MRWLEAPGRKCSSPCKGSPHLQGNSCQEPHPVVFQPTGGPALTGPLSPFRFGPSCHHGTWAKGTFGNADASGGHSSSRPQGVAATLSEGHYWQGGPKRHLSSPLSPSWCGCQSDARRTPKGVEGYCISWQVHSLSSSCDSLLLLLRAARCIFKTSHPGCNVNDAEGSPAAAEAGMFWQAPALYLRGNDTFIPLF